MQESERSKNAKTTEKMAKRHLVLKIKHTFKNLEKTVNNFTQKYPIPLKEIMVEMEKFTVNVKSM